MPYVHSAYRNPPKQNAAMAIKIANSTNIDRSDLVRRGQ